MKSLSHLVRQKNRPARVSYLHDLDARRIEWSRRPAYLMSETSPTETDRYGAMLRSHLTRLNELVSLAGSRMVVIYIPDISQLHHPEFQLINRFLLQTCRQLSIPFADMTPVFEQSREPDRYYLWPDDPHTNRAGHEEMAEKLEQMICGVPEWKPACNLLHGRSTGMFVS